MSIQSHKEKFKTGLVAKKQLVESLHEYHKVLFDFSETLAGTEIGGIEICDNAVCFLTRETNHHEGGVKFVLDKNDQNTTPVTAFNFDILEKDDSEIIFKMVREGDVVFDIGANVGWYSLHLAKKLKTGHIHAFEPIPNTFAQLSENLRINEFGNVSINNIALAETPKTLTFYFSPQFSAAASSRNITGLEDVVELHCTASTLDEYVSENVVPKLDFIKCDVEGAEYFVFQGGMRTLAEFKPIVFTEMLRKWAAKFDYHPNDIINLFRGLGYACFYSDSGKMKEILEVTDATVPTNYLFLHREKHRDLIEGFA